MADTALAMELDSESQAVSWERGPSNSIWIHPKTKFRHPGADYLARLHCDHTVIFTFRNGTGPQLMVPLLHEVADNWRAQRLKGLVSRPLKLTLLQYLVAELDTRVMAFTTDKAAQDQSTGDGLDHERLGVQLHGLERGGTETRPSPRGDADSGPDSSRCQTHEDDPQRARTDLAICRGSPCPTRLSVGNSHLCPGALPAVPGSSRGDGDLPEVVRMFSIPPPVTPPQTGPPGAVAANQGDSGGGRLVNGMALGRVCIPASLASLNASQS